MFSINQMTKEFDPNNEDTNLNVEEVDEETIATI